ncbi:hypothetical protein [Rhizobacter sp. OV335]|uniref:hypothetical protein n=1 Tax=Rhizobacter sp. OV335 TaxID=1500264 RepID=UPI001161253D|nr:hypothetical protein [Rhizobacter sp. OV335]
MIEIVRRLNGQRATSESGSAQDLLERLVVETVAANYRHFSHELLVRARELERDNADPRDARYWCDPPLFHRERQLSALVGHAFSTICPVSDVEYGVARTHGGASYKGRVDYFGLFMHRATALELKMTTVAINAKSELRKVKGRWKEVDEQAKNALAYMKDPKHQKLTYPDPMSVALLVVRLHRGKWSGRRLSKKDSEMLGGDERQEQLRSARQKFTNSAEEDVRNAANLLRKACKARFVATYVPPLEMREYAGQDDEDDLFRIVSGVVFLASPRVNVSSRE